MSRRFAGCQVIIRRACAALACVTLGVAAIHAAPAALAASGTPSHPAPAPGDSSAAEQYVVVGTHLLPRCWHETAATLSLPPRNILAQNPMGCVAVSIRIEPDGTPHQIQIIKAWWKPMLPVYVQMMDAQVVHELRGAHFVPGPINAQRRPVYSYVVQAFFEQSAYSLHPSHYTQQRIRTKSAYLQRVRGVPHFVARVAQAVGTSAPTPE